MTDAARATDVPALELRGVTKRFGALVANDRVDLDLRAGEVHALLGENGAGKSTLMNVLYGLHQPDEGEIRLRGEPIRIESPRHAIGLGIGMVHQHFMLIPVMTVAENIVLAAEPRKGAMLDHAAAREKVREISDRYGLRVDPDATVEDITVGAQQRVEILRALYRGADVLVLDEPTAVLTAQESEELFEVMRELKGNGVAIIFISHKLNEVLAVADRISVLQRGKKVATLDAAGATESELARLMVGRDVLFRLEKEAPRQGKPMLEVSDLHAEDDRGLPAVQGVSFTVHGGEVVGIAGVDGNGQAELIECVTGLRSPTSGSIEVEGKPIAGRGVVRCLEVGVGHIPEDRHRRGLVLNFDLAENLAMREYRRPPLARGGLLSPKRLKANAEPLLKVFDVRGGTPDTPASSLSGGNQQKVVIARELAEDPRVLVAAQPTRGLDVGAIEFVHSKLLEQRNHGRAVLLISLELEELRNVADRLLVIADGRIVGEFPPDASDEELGLAMTGGSAQADEVA